jgi:hypothetical protein
MLTYRHITSKLERHITACALMTFRLIEKPEGLEASWYHYLSAPQSIGMFDAPYDECVVNVETWKLERIHYDVWQGKKVVNKTIELIA